MRICSSRSINTIWSGIEITLGLVTTDVLNVNWLGGLVTINAALDLRLCNHTERELLAGKDFGPVPTRGGVSRDG